MSDQRHDIDRQIGIQKRDWAAFLALGGIVALGGLAQILNEKGASRRVASAAPPIEHQVAAQWKRGRAEFRAVVVPPGTTDAELCALGRWLGDAKGAPMSQFFDDDAHVAEYVATTDSVEKTPTPELVAWLAVHHRGMVFRAPDGGAELRTIRPERPDERTVTRCAD